jgi:hypothetical protein
MAAVVVDAATREKLLTAGDVVEVKDEAGQVIGKFVAGPNPVIFVAEGMDISDEELDRREREGRNCSVEEVMERLRGLGYAG